MTSAKVHRALGVLAWVALLAAIFLSSLAAHRVDFWWQLAEGREILATHRLPTAPGTAFGLPHQPFVDEYSLYEIVLAVLDRIGGLVASHAAFVLIFLLIFAVPLARARMLSRGLFDLGLVALALVFLINRYEQRPEIVGVLLLATLLAIFRRVQNFSPPLLIAIGAIFAVWTNVHSSYLIGLLALGIWLIDRATFHQPRWKIAPALLCLATACAAVLLNPYGWHRVAFTFAEEADPGANLLSREMYPAWDHAPGMDVLMVVTAAALGFAFLRQPRPQPWLIALAFALFILMLLHVRHMSFLAVGLLFLATDPARRKPNPHPIALPLAARTVFCTALVLFDALARRAIGADFSANASEQAFAPRLLEKTNYAAVLAHDGEGSYIEGHNANLFPLLDSGQMHFNDDTKRFYFFTVQDPLAFHHALEELPAVGDVVVTFPVAGWTLALAQRSGWFLGAISPDGLLFRRIPTSVSVAHRPTGAISAAQAAELTTYRDRAISENDFVRAFAFSVLIDRPADSLAFLDRSTQSWSEPFFRFLADWIDRQTPHDLGPFFTQHPPPANPLLRDLLLGRTKPGEPLPPVGPTNLERLARAFVLHEQGEDAEARKVWAALPRPDFSPLYYILRDQLDPAAAAHATPSERWQDWNDGGNELFNRAGPLLNERAAQLVRRTGIW